MISLLRLGSLEMTRILNLKPYNACICNYQIATTVRLLFSCTSFESPGADPVNIKGDLKLHQDREK